MAFKEIPVHELEFNPMKMIGSDWWLITAGTEERGYNTMTGAWGHLGALWNDPDSTHHRCMPTATMFIRPSRYTKEFADREPYFSLCVFDESYRKALNILGTLSGRDCDKVAKAGLTPAFTEKTTYFNEAKYVFICRKLYRAPIVEEGFVSGKMMDYNYPLKDFHTMYIGEITKVLVRE